MSPTTTHIADRRLPPFCWQALDAIELIQGEAPERSIASMLALYLGLTYLAAKRHCGAHEGFAASRAEVAHAAGLSAGSVHKLAAELASIGLLAKEERKIDGRTVAPLWLLTTPGRVSVSDTRVSVNGPETDRHARATDGVKTRTRRRTPTPSPRQEEPVGFEEWLQHHAELTGRRVPIPSKARENLARLFGELMGEGRTLEEMKLASIGAHADEWRRQHSQNYPRHVLGFDTIDELIDKGRKAAKASPAAKRYVRKGPRIGSPGKPF